MAVLGIEPLAGQGVEKLVDNVSFDGPTLARAEWTDTDNDTYDQTDFDTDTGGTGGTVDEISLFSSLGPTGEVDGSERIKPDVIAPGEPIISSFAEDGSNVDDTTKVSATHFKLQGTSMSAPHVAGIIALMLERNNTLTAAQMKAAIRNNAITVEDGEGDLVENNIAGWGKANASASVAAIAKDTSAFSGTGDLETGDVNTNGLQEDDADDGSDDDDGRSTDSAGGCSLDGQSRPVSHLELGCFLLGALIVGLRRRSLRKFLG